MNNYIKNLKFEFKYLNKSGIILLFLVLAIVLVAFLSYTDTQYANSAYERYEWIIEDCSESDVNIEEEIKKGYTLVGDRDNGTVDNAIAYAYEQVGQGIYAASPQYAAVHALELCMGFFPAIFGIFGIFLATTDYKYKMHRQRILRYGRTSYYLTKTIAMLSFLVCALIAFVIINMLANVFSYNYVCNSIPIDQFEVPALPSKSNLLVKIFLVLLEGVTYGSIGFMLGNIFRNSLICTAIVCLDWFIPAFSKFEVKNCFQYIIQDNFEFYGSVSSSGGMEVNIAVAWLIICGTIVVSNVVSFILIKKRSAFN